MYRIVNSHLANEIFTISIEIKPEFKMTIMKYLMTLLVAFLLSFGWTSSTIADAADLGIPEIAGFSIEECILTVKASRWWSLAADEFTVRGDCDEILKLI